MRSYLALFGLPRGEHRIRTIGKRASMYAAMVVPPALMLMEKMRWLRQGAMPTAGR